MEEKRRFFQHDLAKLEHPHIIYDRHGRPGAKLERVTVHAAVRPLIDAIQRILRRGVKGTLTETECLFFHYRLKMENGLVKEHYLDITLCHDGPDRGDGGPIALVSLIQPGAVRWLRDYQDKLIYQSIIEHPEEFRIAFTNSIRLIFGHYHEIP